jgi:succinate dehydrogenase / fumarate reductase membrane anchor subunit
MYKYKGTGNNGTFAWILQRISGIVIAIFGTILFYQLAFGGGSHALSSWLLLPVLMFGTWHTLSGFKMITDDYVAGPIKRFLLLCLYWMIGLAMLAFGLSFATMV